MEALLPLKKSYVRKLTSRHDYTNSGDCLRRFSAKLAGTRKSTRGQKSLQKCLNSHSERLGLQKPHFGGRERP